MEKMIRLGGLLAGCPRCEKQPHLFHNLATSEYHFECHPCRFRMYAVPSVQEAIEVWEDLPRRELINDRSEPSQEFTTAAA